MYWAESKLPRVSNLNQNLVPWLMFANKNKNQNGFVLSFMYFLFCSLLSILISLPSSDFQSFKMRNHFETNKYSFPRKVFNEVCSLFFIIISSVDQLISFKKGKETRSPLKHAQGIPTDRGICWCEEKHAFSKILQAFPLSANLLLLAENKEEKFRLVHASVRCLPARDGFAKGIGLQGTACRLRNEVLLRCPKKGISF